MTIEELIVEGNKLVHKDTSKLILSTVLNMNYLELMLHLNDKVSADVVSKYQKILKNIKNGQPIQYALNNVNFYGRDFYVDDRVLIPRFETEELVYNTNNYINKYFSKKVKILDLGTGSGCIGLTLKSMNDNFDVTLSDLSPYALEVCDINRKNLNLDVTLIESDLFESINSKFDVIISNPPYIGINDKVDKLVIENEPAIALFADNNGLEFYDRILKDCENYLNSRYLIAFEIGALQKDDVLHLIKKYLNDVKVITKSDMSKRDRMIFVFKNIDIIE